ncbi:hypothetical protein B0J11DRAFT_618495 [Dendryphion nanum]|uniref:Uncharacterized protein n=1 Tax=Dendryphion nanum TaxID=256645 RepID=A0A9P9DBB6_9PLEO|nr:hypothetical protein B0J11DRAFT_618495 [Dendryphion nanum]
MPPTRLLSLSGALFGTILLAFGANYLLRPYAAYSTFGLPYVSHAADQEIVNSFCRLFGVKDVFVGVSLYTATFFGSRRTLATLLLAVGVAAMADGAIVKAHGEGDGGEWGHWGYGIVVTMLGGLGSLGVL